MPTYSELLKKAHLPMYGNELDFGLENNGSFSIFLEGKIDRTDPKWFLRSLDQLRQQWNRPRLERVGKIIIVIGCGGEGEDALLIVSALLQCMDIAGIIDSKYTMGKIPSLTIECWVNPYDISMIRFFRMEDKQPKLGKKLTKFWQEKEAAIKTKRSKIS